MKKNLCVIGYGGMGSWHARQALTSDVVNLIGVYDVDETRLEAARENGIRIYSSFEEVLNDKDVDIVTLATPNDYHKGDAIRALNAGKNVISEKPVTLSCKDLQDMIDVANANNKIFTVHQNRRWDEDFLGIKNLCETKQIGDVINVESRVQGSRGIPGDWRGQKVHGGGMLYDWGIHLIDQALQIFKQKIINIYCTFSHITNSEVDDGFKLNLTFEDGVTMYIEVGTYNFISLPRFYVQAKGGSAVINGWCEPINAVKCNGWYESDVAPVQTAAGLTKTMAPRDEITTENVTIELPKVDVHDFYRNVCAAIDGKEEQIVKHDELLRVMKVIEASFESVEKNAILNVNI